MQNPVCQHTEELILETGGVTVRKFNLTVIATKFIKFFGIIAIILKSCLEYVKNTFIVLYQLKWLLKGARSVYYIYKTTSKPNG